MESSKKSDKLSLRRKTLSIRSDASSPKTPRTQPKRLTKTKDTSQRNELHISSDEGEFILIYSS